jgi:hypothetical protein
MRLLVTVLLLSFQTVPLPAYDAGKDTLYRAYLIATIVGVIGAVGGVIVLTIQTYFLKKTVESAGEQSVAMERHIEEAARSATAMENISNAIQSGNRLAMRAYVTTVIGSAIFQERREGEGDLKFEGKVQLLNTGNTPARKVRIRKQAAIVPIPPEHFAFPLPEESADSPYASIGAHQSYVISSVVPDFAPDAEVPSIKEGSNRALCIWGLITYEDIFGETHNTRFAHLLTWLADGKTVYGFYVPGHNEAD